MGDMADSIEWFTADYDYSDVPQFSCPECWCDLDEREDIYGTTYQCSNMSCLSFFDEEEIDQSVQQSAPF